MIHTEIYGDVLFLIDFSIDFLVLFAASRILHLKLRTVRIVLAACLGGAYSVLSLLIRVGTIRTLCTLAAVPLICLVAFGISSFKAFAKTVFLFSSLSALLGGGVTACYSLLDSVFPAFSVQNTEPVPLSVFALVCIACFAAAYASGKLFASSASQKTAELEIIANGSSIKLTLLVDTGDLLTEPISSLPAVVVKKSLLTGLFPGGINAENAKIRVVPTKTAVGNDLLVGFLPDKARLDLGKGKTKCVNCVIAGCDDNAFSDLDGVFPAALL